jgi:hypothetical protein
MLVGAWHAELLSFCLPSWRPWYDFGNGIQEEIFRECFGAWTVF